MLQFLLQLTLDALVLEGLYFGGEHFGIGYGEGWVLNFDYLPLVLAVEIGRQLHLVNRCGGLSSPAHIL